MISQRLIGDLLLTMAGRRIVASLVMASAGLARRAARLAQLSFDFDYCPAHPTCVLLRPIATTEPISIRIGNGLTWTPRVR